MEHATALANESLADYKQLGDRHGMATPLERLSELAYRAGDLPAARRHIEEALELVRGICNCCRYDLLSELAQVISDQGNDTTAVAGLLHECDTLRVELGLAAIEPWMRN
jgi:hypothetical protein